MLGGARSRSGRGATEGWRDGLDRLTSSCVTLWTVVNAPPDGRGDKNECRREECGHEHQRDEQDRREGKDDHERGHDQQQRSDPVWALSRRRPRVSHCPARQVHGDVGSAAHDAVRERVIPWLWHVHMIAGGRRARGAR